MAPARSAATSVGVEPPGLLPCSGRGGGDGLVPWSHETQSNSVSPVDSTACGHRWSMMKHEQRLQVEVYSHGGWWKASNGLTGQVPAGPASKSPMATVAAVANTFG